MLLLGLMTAGAGRDGSFNAKRSAMAKQLGWSAATLTRALHELKEHNEIVVVAPGGGAGKATSYVVTRLAPDQVQHAVQGGGLGVGDPVREALRGTSSSAEHAHEEPVREHVHDPVPSGGPAPMDLATAGADLAAALGGFLRGAWGWFTDQPQSLRLTLVVPIGAWAGWALVEKLAGREFAPVGAALGAAFAGLASTAVSGATPPAADRAAGGTGWPQGSGLTSDFHTR